MEFSTTDEKDAVIVVLIILVIILVAALVVTCCCIESKKEDTLCKRIFRSRDGERRPLSMSNSTDVTVSYSSNQNTRNSRGLLGENEHQTKVKELSNAA